VRPARRRTGAWLSFAALIAATSVASAEPSRWANVVTPAWRPGAEAEPVAGPEHAVPSPVTFNTPELRGLRRVAAGAPFDPRDRLDLAAPRLVELHRLAAIGRRPLLKRWAPGSTPFDALTAPRTSVTPLLSLHVADAQRWSAVIEAGQIGDACPCLGGAPGRVPDGDELPGVPLRLGRSLTPGLVELTWSASCSATATDYAIYEGTIGTWNVHSQKTCSTGGLAATIAPGSGDHYYLVVPLDAVAEGSYGVDSEGTQHSPAAVPCRSAFAPDSCR
jgi:hypothetical protein